MSSASWPPVRVGTALVVCAASLLVACGPAVADGPHGIDDARSVRSGPATGSRLHQPGVQFLPRPGVPSPPAVTALSWAVTDAQSGRILAAKDAHRRLPPASTLKTLFALTVLPKFPQQAAHTVTDAELAGILPGSALVGIKEDVRYSVADLWRGVFLSSGSDAVRTLAAMNGGWEKTVADMGAVARRLGANDTTVRSADGFDSEGQFSSAFDLSVFGRAGLANPDFARLASTKTAKFPESGGTRAFGIQNTNRLLVGSHGVVPYPGLIGVKNGYTSQAGNTLVAAAKRNGRTLLVTVMNPQTSSDNAVYEETRTLLDWGFSAAPRAAGVGTLPATGPIELDGDTHSAVRKSQPAALLNKPAKADAAHGMALAGERDAQRRTVYVWSLSAVGASALAGAGLWWRRRKQRNTPPAPLI
ncbi:D-alanyl-D-alanine carboxypeptidase family protein [Streptomyces sp. NPDC017993]|uniref:D-alanyl-D-alanine carboxypeptidase family protein n=1 Tax=Streptomyces sp. NPDC017993 TaxID=3365027 RepID=UPI0037AB8D0E